MVESCANLPPSAHLRRAVNLFAAWLEENGYSSYDPYDVWGTRYGRFARRFYYRKSVFGLPLIAPVVAAEVLCPQWRSIFVRKQRYATADAQLLLAFANLFQLTGDQNHIQKAAGLAADLLAYSIPGYNGHCWGYPFDWQHHRGLWKKNTPFITATPYCFEAFLRLFDLTGEERYFNTAKSIAQFVQNDLRDTPTSADAAAGSYSPLDNSQVVNASAYRAMVLFEAAGRFARPDYRRSATLNLNFILQSQRADGAWLYAMDEPAEQFIDHFHTCFVLKNLWKLNRSLKSPAVTEAIRRGFAYYHGALFDSAGLPKPFVINPRRQIVRLEMYDFAEAISLGVLLRHDLPEAFPMAQRLARLVTDQFQLSPGCFVTRVYRGGRFHKLPFLRWPQAQLFLALTNMLMAEPSLSAAAPACCATKN
ncbi:MAG: hypothetical protein ABSG59_06680 [Verrucomicrobiota bacterium]|jgi:hypothetical protein